MEEVEGKAWKGRPGREGLEGKAWKGRPGTEGLEGKAWKGRPGSRADKTYLMYQFYVVIYDETYTMIKPFDIET